MIIRLYKETINILIVFLIYFLDIVIIKDKYLTVASSSHGEALFGNPKALFRYINANNSKHRCVFLIKNKDNVNVNDFIYYHFSIRGFWKFLRAKYLIMSHGSSDFYSSMGVYSNRKIIIESWHGIPLKAMGYLEETNISLKRKIEFKIHNRQLNYFLTSSELEKNIISDCFKLNKNKILVTGRPCLDTVQSAKRLKSFVTKILYAPTYRKEKEVNYFPFNDFNLKDLDHNLKTMGMEIYLRSHKNSNNADLLKDSDTIKLFSFNEYPDIYDYINEFDALISDYSSLYFDYLVLDKPIYFIPYDIDEYAATTGLALDYNKFTPGVKISTYSDFKIELFKLHDKIDAFFKERRVVSEKLNINHNINNSEKVFKDIYL